MITAATDERRAKPAVAAAVVERGPWPLRVTGTGLGR